MFIQFHIKKKTKNAQTKNSFPLCRLSSTNESATCIHNRISTKKSVWANVINMKEIAKAEKNVQFGLLQQIE